MLVSLLVFAAAVAQDTDIVLRERPLPVADAGMRRVLCRQLEVEIEYRNVWAKGAPELEGRVSFNRKRRDISGALNEIRKVSSRIDDVRMSCEAASVALVTIDAAGVDAGYAQWRFTIDDSLKVEVGAPTSIHETSEGSE